MDEQKLSLYYIGEENENFNNFNRLTLTNDDF